MVVTTFRRAPAIPPEKGAFPLDHLGECHKIFEEYMACLQNNNRLATRCRVESKKYLECRMHKGLMAEDEWDKLGFKEEESNRGKVYPHTDKSALNQGFEVALPTVSRAEILKKRKEAMESEDYRPTGLFASAYKGLRVPDEEILKRAEETAHAAPKRTN
eukprot:TRINITY_DN11392_c0_g1::TRINITY_DN11392_c0_g1_i1::g.26426::m.26426 TRINITY_DN11392_c0_g1::TRINITY_DN11392_c0_g1_i1::g.26426  ORF type:complete len:160 (-),score=5.75,sp/Q4P821/COX19_USTMA/50.68/9e-21,CHCH/PF06747.8/0.00098,Pet191_N/PF10203.4/0.036,UPF0203/PF05254.7/0.32,UPF0203/PF05254.7/7.2e+02 TRINITY_DN11392_c0_g1_i1:350-829(-)